MYVCVAGNLYFANIEAGDHNYGGIYACEVQLKLFSMYIEGDQSIINIQQGMNFYRTRKPLLTKATYCKKNYKDIFSL